MESFVPGRNEGSPRVRSKESCPAAVHTGCAATIVRATLTETRTTSPKAAAYTEGPRDDGGDDRQNGHPSVRGRIEDPDHDPLGLPRPREKEEVADLDRARRGPDGHEAERGEERDGDGAPITSALARIMRTGSAGRRETRRIATIVAMFCRAIWTPSSPGSADEKPGYSPVTAPPAPKITTVA